MCYIPYTTISLHVPPQYKTREEYNSYPNDPTNKVHNWDQIHGSSTSATCFLGWNEIGTALCAWNKNSRSRPIFSMLATYACAWTRRHGQGESGRYELRYDGVRVCHATCTPAYRPCTQIALQERELQPQTIGREDMPISYLAPQW